MNSELEGTTAVVTGASRGIGLAIVEALTAAGVRVVGGARTPSAALLAATPHALAVDLATPEGPGRLVDHALEQLGGIDLLVNNMGANPAPIDGFLALDDADWQRVLDANLFSMIRATRAALPSLIDRRGAIVGIGSLNAKIPQPPVVAYAAAKAAFANVSKALAEEFAPHGVRVNTISPGPVLTDMWTAPDSPGAAITQRFGISTDDIPAAFGMSTGRITTPQEIAEVVLLLASRSVPNLGGADLVIDGGLQKSL